MKDLIRNILREYTNQNKDVLNECVIAAVRLDDNIFLAKNRDRGYDALVEVIHTVKDGVEMVYWRDTDTDWSEGMNEYHIGIVNASLQVGKDEKEGKEVQQARKKGPRKKKHSYDGMKIRKALTYKTIPKAIKSLISFTGEDKKDVGLKGQTLVSDGDEIYVIELTSKHAPIIKKVNKEKKVTVRTNHGIYHEDSGYTRGIKKKSSHMRMDIAKHNLENAESENDILDLMKKKENKDPFLNPYRTTNKHKMQTTGQIMMNLDDLIVTVRMDKDWGKLVDIVEKFPEGYKPKIKIKIEK